MMFPFLRKSLVIARARSVSLKWNRQGGILNSIISHQSRIDSQSIVSGVSTEPITVKSIDEIPGPKGLHSIPYIGSMFMFHPFTQYKPEKSNFLFAELYRQYGPIVKFRKGWKWSVFLFDPDLIEEAMSYEGHYPIRPSPPLIDALCARTGRKKGISQVQGEEWMSMRKPLQEFLLQPSNINVYIPALEDVSSDLINTIRRSRQDNGQIMLDNILFRYAVESSASYCINTRLSFLKPDHTSNSTKTVADQCPHSSVLELTEEERNELLVMIRTFMRAAGNGYYTFPLFKFFRTNLYNEFEMATKYLSRVIQGRLVREDEALKKNKDDMANKFNNGPNLLQTLLTDGRLDFNTCVALVTGFFTAATDNISKSSAMILWHLAKNPSKQEILRNEIMSKFEDKEPITADKLSHLPYLKACFKESHRMVFPTPLGAQRLMPVDVVLAGYHIPAGTSVNYGHNVLGHCDKYFEKPDEFIPERWLKQATTEKERKLKHQQAIITMPFGFGKRNCVGRRLAEQQIYVAVIKILQNFKMELADPKQEIDVDYKILATPTKPLNIRFLDLNASNFKQVQ